MRHFPAPMTREQSDQFLKKILDYYRTHQDGLLTAEVDSEFIGFVGLVEIAYDAPFTPATEIGWRLIPSAWGKGYATEAAHACLRFAFEQMKHSEIVAMTTPQNTPSQKVMQRIGMTYNPDDDFDHPLLALDAPLLRHVLYRISYDQWVASTDD